MTKIYDAIAKRHKGCSQPDVCLFYDYDREEVIKYIEKYDKKHGFSIDEKGKTYSIADIILRERELTGKKLKDTSYRELFDMYGKRKGKVK